MTTEIKVKEKELGELGLEQAQEFFVDPARPETAEKLASSSQELIRIMAQIYASGGVINKMTPDVRAWLESEDPDRMVGNFQGVMKELMRREAGTRRFDEKFMGQIHPQGSIPGILGMLVGAYMNQNTVVKEVSISENNMEQEVLEWFAEIFGYNKNEFSGNVVTGGTSANLASLWIAREKKIKELRQAGIWDSERSKKRFKFYIVGSDMGHYSIDKTCYLLGTGDVIFIKVPHEGFKTSAQGMREAINHLDLKNGAVTAIIGLAGETETGMVDDLDALANVARDYKAHYHVDAAYGGPFILSKAGHLFSGIQRADTITVDPHKLLYIPYQAGIYLVRRKEDQALIDRAMRNNAGYLSPEEVRQKMDSSTDDRNFGFSRVEGSMGAGGVIATWATIQLLDKEGIAALLNHTLELTKVADEKVKGSWWLTPLHNPETNTLLVGFKAPGGLSIEQHKRVMDRARARLEKEHGYYISTDDRQIFPDGRPQAYRFVFMHPYTTNAHVEEMIRLLDQKIEEEIKIYS